MSKVASNAVLTIFQKSTLTAALALCGCQGVSLPQIKPASVNEIANTIDVALPDVNADSQITLVLWGKRLKVGDSSAKAEAMFPEHTSWVESNDLPSQFGKEFQARSWTKGDDGFGVILYRGRVVAALSHLGGATPQSLKDVLRDEEREMPSLIPEVISGKHAVYRFWEDGPHRLMVLWVENVGKTQLTVAVGDKNVLDALRASPNAAVEDSHKVDERLETPKVDQISQ